MSYTKLPTTVQDNAIGFQSVNQAINNNSALKDQFELRHLLQGGTYSGGAFFREGRHNDALIARTVVRYTIDTTLPTIWAAKVMGGPLLDFGLPIRMGNGQWRINVRASQLVGAVALANASAVVDRKATCLVQSGPTQPSVVVSTWNVATALLEDFDFTLAIYVLA